jgi:general secretion pathway protein H
VTRGFTLIEVVAALLVLALAVGVSAPSVGRGLDGVRLRAEVAGLASFLRAARERAITKGVSYEVAIDPERRELAMGPARVESATQPQDPRVTRRSSGLVHLEPDPPSARTIRFMPHGFSSGGRLRVEAPGPIVYEILVDSITGRVTSRRVPS